MHVPKSAPVGRAALPSRPRSYAEAWPSKPNVAQGAIAKRGRAASLVPKAKAATAAIYKVGAPYEVRGTWYVPAEQPDYEDTGLASWYGDEFHGRPTANGEIFDSGLFTGAHTTLPMPSLVEVTNLENGRTVKVRLNDRGPFSAGRIIDLSRAAAEELGFRAKGTANVRVRYLGRADGTEIAAREPARRSSIELASLSSGGSKGRWVVQAGAFSEPERAGRVAESLKAAGRTSIEPLERDGRTLYRVMVGPWDDGTAAAAARREVAELGFSDAKVVEAF